MIATLPMYDRAETADATDVLWQAVRKRLGHGPDRLSQDIGIWQAWENPNLLFSQTCGLPYRMWLHGRAQIIGTPDYGLPGCPPGHYNSVILTRRSESADLAELIGRRVVISQRHSQSGYAALWSHARSLGLTLGPTSVSGSHAASCQWLAQDRADIAAVDAQTWRLIQRYDPIATELKELARTDPTPALPFITGPAGDVTALRHALRAAVADLDQTTRDTLHLRGIETVPTSAYLTVPTPPDATKIS